MLTWLFAILYEAIFIHFISLIDCRLNDTSNFLYAYSYSVQCIRGALHFIMPVVVTSSTFYLVYYQQLYN